MSANCDFLVTAINDALTTHLTHSHCKLWIKLELMAHEQGTRHLSLSTEKIRSRTGGLNMDDGIVKRALGRLADLGVLSYSRHGRSGTVIHLLRDYQSVGLQNAEISDTPQNPEISPEKVHDLPDQGTKNVRISPDYASRAPVVAV